MTVLHPSKINKLGDYAYFASTGPPGESCRSCAHKHCGEQELKWRCGKAAEMRGVAIRSLKPISLYVAACKYWEKAHARTNRSQTVEQQFKAEERPGMDGVDGDQDPPY